MDEGVLCAFIDSRRILPHPSCCWNPGHLCFSGNSTKCCSHYIWKFFCFHQRLSTISCPPKVMLQLIMIIGKKGISLKKSLACNSYHA